ncbi:MAG: type II toxin-antitoxin system HicB family antitoxin [Pyrinomonadaceae bacterium]|nr:type II toxin-antitoxin system HicB family antitoxin [Pyrinomonadaceae bacterium]
MKLPKLTAVIEKERKWYVATCPELGVASQGRSLEEAEAMIQEESNYYWRRPTRQKSNAA